MDAVMRQLLDAQSELLSHQESLDGIKQSILQGEVIVRHFYIFQRYSLNF